MVVMSLNMIPASINQDQHTRVGKKNANDTVKDKEEGEPGLGKWGTTRMAALMACSRGSTTPFSSSNMTTSFIASSVYSADPPSEAVGVVEGGVEIVFWEGGFGPTRPEREKRGCGIRDFGAGPAVIFVLLSRVAAVDTGAGMPQHMVMARTHRPLPGQHHEGRGMQIDSIDFWC
ncbi:hypothetical protein BHE74_00037388 [Ensete ventricosum]|nr:hypothetical protein GW17_00016721 [Ensete ventricosum]RWW55925.1 hypothetical protein BHE74_00037388 [Ensete ventricosum]RZR95971.1 hypothetical protein BHM03_00024877 [Ensete ventricosum]